MLAPPAGVIVIFYDVLAWGFVTFTGLLVLGVLYLWWLERNTDRP